MNVARGRTGRESYVDLLRNKDRFEGGRVAGEEGDGSNGRVVVATDANKKNDAGADYKKKDADPYEDDGRRERLTEYLDGPNSAANSARVRALRKDDANTRTDHLTPQARRNSPLPDSA